MQADHIALREDLIQRDEIACLADLPRWIADAHVPAKPAQHFEQPPAHLTGTDHAETPPGQRFTAHLRQREQAAQNIVDYAPRVAPRCAGPLDAGLLEIIQIQMIGAYRAGPDESHCAAFQHLAVNPSHRAHQQHVDILQCSSIDAAAGHAANLAETGKELIDQRNVFIGEDMHCTAPVRGSTF